jgi:hypothetical protein
MFPLGLEVHRCHGMSGRRNRNHRCKAAFGESGARCSCESVRLEGSELRSALEQIQAAQALQAARGLVVDLTALATLRLLGLTKILSSEKFKFIVSQRTRITIREKLVESRMFSAPGGTLFYEGGKHSMYEESAEVKRERSEEEERFVREVEKFTEIKSGFGLAAIQPSRRETLEQLFGSYGAESIVIASDPEYVLWTDDAIQAQCAAQEFGVRRVWTQVVLQTLADLGLISPDEYCEASARLIGMEFVVTLFDASILLSGFRLAEWSAERSPIVQFIEVFADPAADLKQLFILLVGFVTKAFREPISEETKCRATQALLDAMAGRDGAIEGLKSVRGLSQRIFGVNALGQTQFDNCFDLWLAHRTKQLILLP